MPVLRPWILTIFEKSYSKRVVDSKSYATERDPVPKVPFGFGYGKPERIMLEGAKSWLWKDHYFKIYEYGINKSGEIIKE
jgi:hypothetical protein